MKPKTFAALCATAGLLGIWRTDAGAEAPEQPATWYATCANAGRTHPVLAGTLLVNGSGHTVELVGPVATSHEGALAFARLAEQVMGDECEPTHMSEVWKIGVRWDLREAVPVRCAQVGAC